ncbi:MAG: hypothetical protein ACAI35_09270 [Candidatus Methylacidiphilales bacterium]|nr:hypothetical protein [Candidatus Methylacidiphilales bacterium]
MKRILFNAVLLSTATLYLSGCTVDVAEGGGSPRHSSYSSSSYYGEGSRKPDRYSEHHDHGHDHDHGHGHGHDRKPRSSTYQSSNTTIINNNTTVKTNKRTYNKVNKSVPAQENHDHDHQH